MRTLSRSAMLMAIAGASAVAQSAPHRAILISFDGFSEQRFREYSDSATAPNIWSLFTQGVCAESVRPAFPSVTPTSHASIWTGAYPNVNGVSAHSNAELPIQDYTILDWIDGYKAAALRAEPIWITAARQGKTVFSHMATQSPQPPSYTPEDWTTPALDSARARAAAAIVRPNIAALNVYNDLVDNARLIRSPANLSWPLGTTGDSLHARIQDANTVVVQLNHDAARTVSVRLARTDTTSPRSRPLARFFSAPLRIELKDGRRTFLFFRLWELAPDRSKLMLFVSEARVIQANRPEVAAEYDAAVQGVPGNGAGRLLERGEFGARAPNGGDGTAEYRYLETAELVTRQYMKGTEWGWAKYHPEFETDYLPYPDETLHTFLGYADPSTPGVSRAGRENAAHMLKRSYELMDVRVAQLKRLAASTPSTRLFVTGEHGMRPSWASFRPNVALRDAGLVVLDSAGAIDLKRTRAATTYGGWVTVNRVARKGGIVPPDSVNAVIAQVERALRAARDSAGKPIVTRLFRAGTVEGDSLGIGGAGGGDVYFGLAAGYYWAATPTGPLVVPMGFPQGEHGYPSIDHDMHPALCILGAGSARRIGEVRSIDIAPSISGWLGISPPSEARGKALSITTTRQP